MQIEPKIAIIGASGFVGANLLNGLVKNNLNAHGFARSQSPWRIEAFQLENHYSYIGKSLNQTLKAYNPNVVINAATHGAYSFQQDEKSIIDSNLEVVNEIVNWAKETSIQLIHLGTSSEYGANSNRPLETSLCEPNSKYAEAKLETTLLLKSAYDLFGLKSTVLRLYSIYGPLEDPSRLMPTLVNKIINDEKITLTDSEVSRDFIYIQDLLDLIGELIKRHKEMSGFEIYNVASGKKTTMGDLGGILNELFPSNKGISFGYPMRNWDLKDWVGNPEKILRKYDWKSSISITEGMMKLMEFYLVNDNQKYLQTSFSERKNDKQK
jgi:dolichol-phosphate mannosyltransferase